MGKMSYIAYLIEHRKDEELRQECSSLAEMLGIDLDETVEEFKKAYFNIEKNKDKPAFKQLSKIQKEMLEHEETRKRD